MKGKAVHTLLALTDSCQARAAHNRQSVFPVPVGLSSKAFFPCSVLLDEVQQDHSPTMTCARHLVFICSGIPYSRDCFA